MPSLDIVSEVDLEEIRNATENANRELSTRFDFRGVEASFEYKNPDVTVKAEGDFQVQQMLDMLRAKLSKRHGALGVDAYRDMGYLPDALKNHLLRLGWGHGDDECRVDIAGNPAVRAMDG